MITLNGVRLVVIQFSFSNPAAIPAGVARRAAETQEEHVDRVERKSRETGLIVIEPTQNCSLATFAGEFEGAGYELVDAFYQERRDRKDPRAQRTYHMVRFVFAQELFADVSDEFRSNVEAALTLMCRQATWRVRAFLNPFYSDGQEVPGQSVLSINLEARTPAYSLRIIGDNVRLKAGLT